MNKRAQSFALKQLLAQAWVRFAYVAQGAVDRAVVADFLLVFGVAD